MEERGVGRIERRASIEAEQCQGEDEAGQRRTKDLYTASCMCCLVVSNVVNEYHAKQMHAWLQ